MIRKCYEQNQCDEIHRKIWTEPEMFYHFLENFRCSVTLRHGYPIKSGQTASLVFRVITKMTVIFDRIDSTFTIKKPVVWPKWPFFNEFTNEYFWTFLPKRIFFILPESVPLWPWILKLTPEGPPEISKRNVWANKFKSTIHFEIGHSLVQTVFRRLIILPE